MEKKHKIREFIKSRGAENVGLAVGAATAVTGLVLGAVVGANMDANFNATRDDRVQSAYEQRYDMDRRAFEYQLAMNRAMGLDVKDNPEPFLADTSAQRRHYAGAETTSQSGGGIVGGMAGTLGGFLVGVGTGIGAAVGTEKLQDVIRDKEREERRQREAARREAEKKEKEQKKRQLRRDIVAQSKAHRAEHGTDLGKMEQLAAEKRAGGATM